MAKVYILSDRPIKKLPPNWDPQAPRKCSSPRFEDLRRTVEAQEEIIRSMSKRLKKYE